ncbi:MAG TPA: dihydropteroate synthase, partial [Chloroflexota bacterium]|nr:dihydropteroate synthase [Chloroflexota bacterium]
PTPTYASVVSDVTQFLHQRIQACVADGISADRLVIDPGPSFGKTTEQDLSLMSHWSEFRGFPQPVMLAVSRKRFIGETLAAPPEKLLNGSLAMAAYAVTNGVDMVRTHDVAATREAIRIVEAVRGDRADRQ